MKQAQAVLSGQMLGDPSAPDAPSRPTVGR
jgi:hypothetical protein